MLDILAANRDVSVFPHTHELNFDRVPNPMVTSGCGIHACVGQQIAHMELRVLRSTLLRRLAVSPEEVPWRLNDSATFGWFIFP
ncbi:cytochrome P450 [Thermosporothrix hazakensis]|uniref:Cytochrome P450 n=2 Tax=Thermosporothrix hazakensis TaxID=644383 RepID=A0A326U2V4_THEHA|nr:cytochrome P450 [Thermosporothrix hazakensis]